MLGQASQETDSAPTKYTFPTKEHPIPVIIISQTETGLLLVVSFTYQIQKCKHLLINFQVYKHRLILLVLICQH